MRKPLLGVLLLVTTACAVGAQEVNLPDGSAKNAGNAAASYGENWSTRATLVAPSGAASEPGSFAGYPAGGVRRQRVSRRATGGGNSKTEVRFWSL